MAIEWMSRPHRPPALLATVERPYRLTCYALLAISGGGVFIVDVVSLGLSLAVKHGLAAFMICWILLVPLGIVLVPFASYLWLFGILAVGFTGATYAFLTLPSSVNKLTSALFLFGTLWVAINPGEVVEYMGQLENVFSIVVLYMFIYWLARICSLAVYDFSLAPIHQWQGVSMVEKDSEEFREKQEAFNMACAGYQQKYHFDLLLKNLYRVGGSNLLGSPVRNHGRAMRRTFNGRPLFHGTRRFAANKIITQGFRLPETAGMFGKGVYFADCPLKSWGYTGGKMFVRDGLILLCWVELGRPKHEKEARNHLTTAPRRSLVEWVRGERQYTSVVGDVMEAGGALRAPEYVIYDPANAEVDYICEVCCVRPGT